MTDHKQPVPIKLLNVQEVAAMLSRTEPQLRWMMHQGTAPKSAKIGGRIMFREADVINFINAAFGEQE